MIDQGHMSIITGLVVFVLVYIAFSIKVHFDNRKDKKDNSK